MTMRSGWLAGLLWTLVSASGARAQDPLDQALQLRRSGRPDASLTVVEAQLAAAPQDERLRGLKGLLLLDLCRRPEAEALAAELDGYEGGEFRVHLFLGRLACERGESLAGLPHLKRAVDAAPEAIEPLSTLVQAQLAAGKLRAAITHAERLEGLSPQLGRKLGAQAYLAQARRHREHGDEAAPLAIEDYRKALEKQPGDLNIVRLLANTLIDISFIAEAQALIREHFDPQTHPVDWHYLSGRCHSARLEHAAAERELLAVLASDARHVPALIELSKLALDDGRAEQARQWLETATAADPESCRAWMMLGEAREALRDDAGAESAYRRACQLAPSNVKANYVLGRLLLRTGRAEEGEPLLQQVVAGAR